MTSQVSNDPDKVKQSKVKKKKCQICKKKLNIIEQSIGECKCNKILCTKHRYPQEHNCTFDHNKTARETLMKQNPIVKSQKVIPI